MRGFLAVAVLFGGLVVGGIARRNPHRGLVLLLVVASVAGSAVIAAWQRSSGYLFLPPVLPIVYFGMAADARGHRLSGIGLLSAGFLLLALGGALIAYG